MAIPLYNMLMGGGRPQVNSLPMAAQYTNPVQMMNGIMQAMKNPSAFVRQQLPDMPESIVNDPNQILGYLQNRYGITNAQIQQVAGKLPFGMR